MSKLKCPNCGYKLKEDNNFTVLLAALYPVIPVDDNDYTIDKKSMEEGHWIKCKNCDTTFERFDKE